MDRFDVRRYGNRTQYISKSYPHISITLNGFDQHALIRVKRDIMVDIVLLIKRNLRITLAEELERLLRMGRGEQHRVY